MSGANDLQERILLRIRQAQETLPGSLADQLSFRLLDCGEAAGEVTFSCETAPWMGNFAGTLHGGIGAAILDQAMGYVTYGLQRDAAAAPTTQLSVDYHRPVKPGETVLVKVHVVSRTRRFLKLTAEAFSQKQPDRICFSGSGIHFFPMEVE